MKKILTYIIVITVSVVVGYVVGRNNNSAGKWENTYSDTTTVTVYDSVQVRIPEPVVSRYVGIEIYPIAKVPVLLYHSDTITKPYYVNNELIIPISQRYYKDNRYEAWVSGYNPRLDSLLILTPTKTVTIENTRIKTAQNELFLNGKITYIAPFPAMTLGLEAGYKRNRWGINVGAGVISTTEGVKWYGSVGLSYNFIKTQW